MAKTITNRKGKKRKFSIKDRFNYHTSREKNCSKHGIKFGGSKHSYSCGFVDAFSGRDNTSATTREFGKRSGNAYSLGYKRGRKASLDYFNKTGKQPADLKYEK